MIQSRKKKEATDLARELRTRGRRERGLLNCSWLNERAPFVPRAPKQRFEGVGYVQGKYRG
jgi:hypothetical protein